jgi:hypothetical protein
MSTTDLCYLPAHELVRLMTNRSVSLPGSHVGAPRTDQRVNRTLNALVEATAPERCLRLADHADECAARGDPLGAAHGLPIAAKDVLKVAGLEDPHPLFARLLAAEPVSWLVVRGGWLVAGYDLVVLVMRDPVTSTVDDPRFSTLAERGRGRVKSG